MKGLELSRAFYLECGAPMIAREFSELEGILAIGLVGSGSECFGYDDSLSEDHDFEPGFCIFLPDESVIDSRTAFRLERAYSKLPREFRGYRRSDLSPVGSNRHGVIRIEDFLLERTGSRDGALSVAEWFSLPEQSLLEVINGEIFRDDSQYFSNIRRSLAYFPSDVRKKKLAGQLLLMGQSGQYNYKRCIERGESGAAALAAGEFVRSAMSVIFLLNSAYMPYYKWSFRALRSLPLLSYLEGELEWLISSPNSKENSAEKQKTIERVCELVAKELTAQGLSDYSGNEAEGHAYSVNNKITDPNIRNLHILYGV